MDASALGIAVAFAAGMVSFLSPCVLPLVPAYVSYVAGESMDDAQRQMHLNTRIKMAGLGAFFVLGFGLVFLALGTGATALGRLFLQYRYEANIAAGIIVMLFGLLMLGAFGRVSWLHRDFRFHPRIVAGHPAAALVLGFAFGFGWTPCIGPVLGAILTLSATQDSLAHGARLLVAYALGLGVPFLLCAMFMRELLGRWKALRRIGHPLQTASGIVLVAMGVAMVTGQLTAFSFWILQTFPALGRIG